MTDEALLRLALRAIEDREARPILGDAVLESGWHDARVTWLLTRKRWDVAKTGEAPECLVRTRSIRRAANRSLKNARNPTERWCRAVAAVLMFRGWQTKIWAGVYPNWKARTDWLRARMQRAVRELYRDVGLSEMIYGRTPFFEMAPKEPPQPPVIAGLDAWLPREETPAQRFGALHGLLEQGVINAEQFREAIDLPSLEDEVEELDGRIANAHARLRTG